MKNMVNEEAKHSYVMDETDREYVMAKLRQAEWALSHISDTPDRLVDIALGHISEAYYRLEHKEAD